MKKVLIWILKALLYTLGFTILLFIIYLLGAKNVESMGGALVAIWVIYEIIAWIFKKISLGWRRATYDTMVGTFSTSSLKTVKQNKSYVYQGESVRCPQCNSTLTLWGSGGGARIVEENHKKYCPHCNTRIKISGDPWDED